MFSIWLAKQVSAFCGTWLMTSRMFDNSENCCPNCLQPNERAYHLNLCLNQERTRQFHESIEQFEKWLDRSHTHPDIAFWIPRYLRSRNRVPFASLHYFTPPSARLRMTPLILALAEDQDEIGWINFMKGKISKHFLRIQQTYLAGSNSRINGRDWVSRFIKELLAISHTQWLFRNITLHDRKRGFIVATQRAKQLRSSTIHQSRMSLLIVSSSSIAT